MDKSILIGLAASLGIGLLVGIERERSTHDPQKPAPAGVRTFTLAALLGTLAAMIDEPGALIGFGLVVGLYAALAYRHQDADPGLTTEIALIVTYLLGALALSRAGLAAGLGVVVTIVLSSRSWLHDVVRNRLSRQEVGDGLLLAAAALVILPLIPNRTIDPWDVLNPRVVWTLAVLFMAINGVAYVALRTLGSARGLAVAGFAGGFVSSSATHSAMGARARETPELLGAAVAAAALSSVATVVQLALVAGVTEARLLRSLALPLVLAGLVAVVYGALQTWRSLRSPPPHTPQGGRAFDPRHALLFALVMSGVIIASALLVQWLGTRGALLAAGLSGFGDTHAAAAGAGTLLSAGALEERAATMSVLVGFSTNTVTKCVLAGLAGGRRFLLRLAPGLVLMVAAAWLGLWLQGT